jgi:hypothetical protein
MKINFKHAILACAIFLFGVSSCTTESDPGGGEVEEGKPTYMTIALNFPKSDTQTRATGDTTATLAETEIKKVDVYIYNGSGIYLSHTPLTFNDFNQQSSTTSADVYKTKSKIQTTTGLKHVFVGINLPSSIAVGLENKPMSELSNAEKTLNYSDLTGSNGFVMCSDTVVAGTFVENDNDPANEVRINVTRLVAKVTVQTAANLQIGGVPGTLDNLEFAVNNFNTKSYLIQGEAPDFKDPNWPSGSYSAADFINDPLNTGGYAPILDLVTYPNPGVNDYSPRYAAENTSEDHTKGEITRVTVRATFIPATITVDASGTTAPNPASSPATFWVVSISPNDPTAYFANSTVATDYAVANGLTASNVEVYTNGYCYWDMFLNKQSASGTGSSAADRWDVLRNDYYKCTISRIVAPGRSTPDVVDPTTPPATDTSISVEINVLFWNLVTDDYVLEP